MKFLYSSKVFKVGGIINEGYISEILSVNIEIIISIHTSFLGSTIAPVTSS